MKTSLKLIALAILASSCTGRLFVPFSENVDVTPDMSHEMIVLGDRLEDPYSVSNVTKALESLYPTKAGRVVVEPTHSYVRFLPANESEYDRLEALGITLLDHPVDYEIIREGDYYHDPAIPEDEFTWQYAVVEKGFHLPAGIRCELLHDCYIVQESDATKADGIDWAEVEREAYRLTGNAGMLAQGTKAESGVPKGRVTIVDDKLRGDPEGVKGVRVSCNAFVKFAHAYTDEEGYYEMSRSFSSDVRYRLVFKNKKGFGIGFNLIICPASFSTMGKGSPVGMDLEIDRNSERKLFSRAVVNNAAYDYYCDCEKNCRAATPPSDLRLWLFQNLSSSSAILLQQGALIDNSILAQYLGEYLPLLKMFLPDLTIGLNGCAGYASIYTTAIHELAHSSHFMKVGTGYWDTYIKFILVSFITSGFVTYGAGTEKDHGYCEVGEDWAYYVQTKVYQERYSAHDVFGTSYWFSPQIFLNMDDRGINRYRIFAALDSDVCDLETLQTRLLSLYPESKGVINQAFGRYN